MRWVLFFVILSSFALAQPIPFCEGCLHEGRCISYESQISTMSGMMYCAEDSNLYLAKPDSSACSLNYECVSFFCSSGICQAAAAKVLGTDGRSFFFTVLIVIGSVIFLALLFLLIRYLLKPKSSKKPSKSSATYQSKAAMPSVIRIVPVKKKYSPFEKIDKQLEAATKKLTRK
jgi:hypothetical protein